MAIEKALNRAPLGIDKMTANPADMEPDIEIEIEDPEEVTINVGGLEIVLDPDNMEDDEDFGANLAEAMEEEQLVALVSELIEDFEDDTNSRRDWMQTYVDGLELLGMKVEDRSEPWPGACGVYHPLLSEALVKFQSETMMETFPAQGPVKTKVIGKETPEKLEVSRRVKDDMNFQLTERMVEYRPEHERMLWGLGLSGNSFKKVYFDPGLNRQVSIYIPAEDVVVPYGASNIETAERVTHVMRKTANEIKKLQVAGFYRNVELDEPGYSLDDIEKSIAEKMGFSATSDDRHRVLEMHVDLDLPGYEDKDEDGEATGIALPYVVTVEKTSEVILAIRRNWNQEDKTKQKRNHFVHYSYVPGFGFYAFGLIHLVGAFAKSGTSIIRQLVDAGTLSNLPGGFKTKGLRVKGDDTPISPAEFRDVDVASGTIRDNIMTLPYKEPSQVLAALLDRIVEEGRRFASAADMKISDMSGQAPVGTTLAILERTLKIMSAVQARVHYSMKQELKLLKNIIRDYADDEYTYEPAAGEAADRGRDYDQVEVIPVSDPNAATMAQKVVQYQAVLQMAQSAPQLYDMPYLHRQMLEVLGIKNAEKLVPMEDDQKPTDPVTENMNLLRGKPVKAFLYQDHEAHIAVHMAAAQDPKMMQMLQQSPMAKTIGAAFQEHLADHLAMAYRKQIEDAAGVPYPTPDDRMDENTELEISRLAAAAAKQVLGQNQAEQAAKQAQQAQQDPIVQMQQAELQIKQAEAQTKAQKLQVEAADKADRLELEKERIASQERIAGMQVGARIASEKDKLSAQQQKDGLEMGVQIAREAAQEDRAMRQKTQEPQGEE